MANDVELLDDDIFEVDVIEDPVINLSASVDNSVDVTQTDQILNTSRVTIERKPDISGALITIQDDGKESSAYLYDGAKGNTGNPGYTPIRGTDYWTENDVESIIAESVTRILDIYPAAEGVEF